MSASLDPRIARFPMAVRDLMPACPNPFWRAFLREGGVPVAYAPWEIALLQHHRLPLPARATWSPDAREAFPR